MPTSLQRPLVVPASPLAPRTEQSQLSLSASCAMQRGNPLNHYHDWVPTEQVLLRAWSPSTPSADGFDRGQQPARPRTPEVERRPSSRASSAWPAPPGLPLPGLSAHRANLPGAACLQPPLTIDPQALQALFGYQPSPPMQLPRAQAIGLSKLQSAVLSRDKVAFFRAYRDNDGRDCDPLAQARLGATHPFAQLANKYCAIEMAAYQYCSTPDEITGECMLEMLTNMVAGLAHRANDYELTDAQLGPMVAGVLSAIDPTLVGASMQQLDGEMRRLSHLEGQLRPNSTKRFRLRDVDRALRLIACTRLRHACEVQLARTDIGISEQWASVLLLCDELGQLGGETQDALMGSLLRRLHTLTTQTGQGSPVLAVAITYQPEHMPVPAVAAEATGLAATLTPRPVSLAWEHLLVPADGPGDAGSNGHRDSFGSGHRLYPTNTRPSSYVNDGKRASASFRLSSIKNYDHLQVPGGPAASDWWPSTARPPELPAAVADGHGDRSLELQDLGCGPGNDGMEQDGMQIDWQFEEELAAGLSNATNPECLP